MNAATIPNPAPLTEETMLPFRLWPVADLVDGQRSVADIARQLGRDARDVHSALQAIELELGTALSDVTAAPLNAPEPALPEPVTASTAASIDALTLAAVETIGPMGEVIVEDALDDLGEDAPVLNLIARVAQDLREPQRTAFLGRLRSKGLL